MSALAAVLAQLERYDDDAWAALASRGLLRRARKDLGTAEVVVVEDGEQVVRVQVGPQEVTLDVRGPAHALCSCPAATVCQHVVAAGLWLVGQQPAGDRPVADHPVAQVPGDDSPAGAAPDRVDGDTDDAGPLHRDLMDLDLQALVRHAGTPGYRWARQFVEDLGADAVRITSGKNLTIRLARPVLTFRYMGGGLPGLVPDTRLHTLEKYQVAAALAYQRAHGAELPEAGATARPARADATLTESRSRLRASTARLLTDTVALGLSHLSPAVHQRFETVAVWAQGAEYHRLALLLRRLADHVELLLERSARADEQLLLDEAALAYALVAALDAAAAAGTAPTHLVGRARNRYDAVGSMELVGLGAVPWRAASGYRGLTTLFWWPRESRFVSLTDARPETLRGFDPRGRYTTGGPWQGLSSPAATTGARVRLRDAQLSAGGRLSGVERTRASVEPLSGAELAASLPVVESWDALGRADTGLLDVPDPLRDWVVLRPAAYGSALFDRADQALWWDLVDGDGSVLPLTVTYSAETAHLVAQVEGIARAGSAAGALVVCRLRRAAQGLTGEPLSLVHPGRPPGEAVWALHFSDVAGRAPAHVARTGREARRGDGGTHPSPSSPHPAAPPSSVPTALQELRGWLVRQAERGTGATAAAVLASQLEGYHRSVRDIGLDVFPAAVPHEDVAAQLLRSHFLVRQVTALLTGESSER